ncbi:MAG: hypothetical protein Q9202_004340 [Teloschistes flavicans]
MDALDSKQLRHCGELPQWTSFVIKLVIHAWNASADASSSSQAVALSPMARFVQYPHLDVQVYEAAPAFREIGAGVAFGPNSQRALDLIAPAAGEALRKHATPNLWASHANIFQQYRVGVGEREGTIICEQMSSTGMQSAHRAHFLDELVKAVPAQRAHFNNRL